MTDIRTRLKALKTPVVLYGTGDGADRLLADLKSLGVKISGVFASDGFVRKREFGGFPVESFNTLFSRFPDMTVLMCFGSERREVLENVKRISSKVPLYFPEYPVYGDSIFTAEFAREHKNELEAVRSILADELSVKTFDNIVNFRLTGEIKYLFECESENEPLFSLPKDTVFLDLGAYNGDTVRRFTEENRSYGAVIAAEPDSVSFRKLTANTANIENITLLNNAVGDVDGVIFVDSKKGRGTHVSSDGKKAVRSFCVDGLLKDESRPIYIKADVEGNEQAFIGGAQKTISSKRPVMRIACYHRSEDIFALPLAVLGLNGGYKVFLRHKKGVPSWNTEYFFV